MATVELARRPLLGYVLEAMTGALDDVAIAAKAATALPGSRGGERLRVPGSPPDLFFNVNSFEDLQGAAAELGRRRRG